MKFTNPGPRPDWEAVRDSIDLAAVATDLLGPPPGRRGGQGLWWSCRLGSHEDRNPSFCVDPDKRRWKCWGCGEYGDAAALVMRLRNVGFPEAVAYLTGGAAPSMPGKPSARPVVKPKVKPPPEPPAEPKGLPEAEALALVDAAAHRLWTPEGADALRYLRDRRRLTDATIKAARLGWTPGAMVPTRDGERRFSATGWVVPWFDASGRLAKVNIRQPDGRKKYVQAFTHPARMVCYPSIATIRPACPLIFAEGEFDALLLGQALDGLASVVTRGCASQGWCPALRPAARRAAPWFLATDADSAGDNAAAKWTARARRVRPPEPYNDWTDAAADGVDLRRWWTNRLDGDERPPLFAWDELSTWRWGGADDAPGIDRPRGGPPSTDTLEAIREGRDL